MMKTRGRPPKDNPKISISLRVDNDILKYYKSFGKGYQTRMIEALRKDMVK